MWKIGLELTLADIRATHTNPVRGLLITNHRVTRILVMASILSTGDTLVMVVAVTLVMVVAVTPVTVVAVTPVTALIRRMTNILVFLAIPTSLMALPIKLSAIRIRVVRHFRAVLASDLLASVEFIRFSKATIRFKEPIPAQDKFIQYRITEVFLSLAR